MAAGQERHMSRTAKLTFTGTNGQPMTAAQIRHAMAAAIPGTCPLVAVTFRGKVKKVTVEVADTGEALGRAVAEAERG